MNIKGRYRFGISTMYDADSGEEVFAAAPIQYREDFLGAGKVAIPAAGVAENGVDWVKKIVGAAPPTVAGLANTAAGVVRLALTATNEKQDAALYHGDQLGFDATKGLVWEARAALHVLPSGAGAQMVMGVSSAWIDGPDNASYYLEFGAKANGTIYMRSQDGVTQNEIATNVTVVADAFHLFRIDASDVNNVRFYIDGNKVSTDGAIEFAAVGANAILQPYASMYKAAGVVVGTLDLDFVKVWANRS